MSTKREHFSSALGFILMSAGCAIGIGNVWRFPFITGQHGGALFVLIYIVFLILLGFPLLLMEMALGRGGRSTFPGCFRRLQNKQTRFRWDWPAYVLFLGNLVLLMFYSVVTGWMLAYTYHFTIPSFRQNTPQQFEKFLGDFLSSPIEQSIFMLLAVIITIAISCGGLKNVVEKVVKIMMIGLFAILLILVGRAITLPGAKAGLSFFLCPNLDNFRSAGILPTIKAAMAHAFFTLSIGIGSIAILGSYTSKKNSLPGNAASVILLDTLVAICAGLIIFPSCFSFGVKPGAGPTLIFLSLPNVFKQMPGGSVWGMLFFAFMSIAALSTLIAVFENLVAFGMDELKLKRRKSCIIFGIVLILFSFPCIFGFNIWKNFQPFGPGSCVLDLEDFIVSDNLLILGALYLSIFCLWRKGWGKENFLAEVNRGNGLKLHKAALVYMQYVVPAVILIIWIVGLLGKFGIIKNI